MKAKKVKLCNHSPLCLTVLMFLSQSCTMVLLWVVYTSVIYAVIIFKAHVGVVQSVLMPILGMSVLSDLLRRGQV